MAREMGVLADVQSGEALVESSNCTVAWDATELSGVHINEVHVATPTSNNSDTKRTYLTLSVAHLAGGTTDDYTTHTQRSLSETADTYAQYKGEETAGVLNTVQSHITASIADRVVVNKCVAEQLKKSINPELVAYHCNVHPLDSIASKSRAALKDTGVKGSVYGQYCAASNLLINLSKLRYKQGKGDPVAFKAFFKSRAIPLKLFLRYVGNRLHILFHLAGTYFHLQELVIDLLSNFCAPRGGLTAALLKEMQNPIIPSHLQSWVCLVKYSQAPGWTCFTVKTKRT